MPQKYLGYGTGIGAAVSEDNIFDYLVYDGLEIPLRENTTVKYELQRLHRVDEYAISVTPGRLNVLWALNYRFLSKEVTRTIEVDLHRSAIEVTFDRLDTSIPLSFETTWIVARTDKKSVKLTSPDILPKPFYIEIYAHDESGHPIEIECASNAIRITARQGSRIVFGVVSISPFDRAFVVTATYQQAACASSIFHTPGKYIAVTIVEGTAISTAQRKEINHQLDLTGCSSFVTVGIDRASIDNLLWDKSDSFRNSSLIYETLEQLSTDPSFAHLPILRSPERSLPIALLCARRRGARLFIDQESEFAQCEAQLPRRHLVSYEGLGATAIVASNFAFHCDADLAEVGVIDEPTRAAYAERVASVQRAALDEDPRALQNRAEELKKFVKETVRLDVSPYKFMTAFTFGISYSVAFALPIGHMLDTRSAAAVTFDIFKRHRAWRPLPTALLVSTADFPDSELTRELQSMANNFVCSVLEGEASRKVTLLALLQTLSPAMVFIVAHGGAEEFYEDTFEVKTSDGVKVITVKNSNREIPEFSSTGLKIDSSSIRLVTRKLTSVARAINGIKLNDALVTADDIKQFFQAPVVWGPIINNGCATWTSLGSTFMETGSSGYVGTLWPIEEDHAAHVGAALLRSPGGRPLSSVIAAASAERGELARANYVCAGTALTTISSQPAAREGQRRAFVLAAFVEAHFQEVIQKCPEPIVEMLMGTIEHLRGSLFQLVLAEDEDCEPILWLWKASCEEIVERRLGNEGKSVGYLEAAIKSLDRVSPVKDGGSARLQIVILAQMARTFARFGQHSEANAAIGRARAAVADARSIELELLVCMAALTLADVARDHQATTAELQILRELLRESGQDVSVVPERPIDMHPASARPLHLSGGMNRLRNCGAHPSAIATGLFSLAESYRDAGHLDMAIAAYERCLEVYLELNDHVSVAMTCNNLGIVLRAKGERFRATELFKRSLRLKGKLGSRGIGNTLIHLSELTDDEAESRRLLDLALEHARHDADSKCVGEVLICKGRRLSETGDSGEAVALLREAKSIGEALGSPPLVASAQIELGIALLKKGLDRGALSEIVTGHGTLAANGLFVIEFQRADTILAVWAQSGEAALEMAVSGAKLFKVLGPNTARDFLRRLFSLYLSNGNTTAAKRVYETEPLAFAERDRLELLSPEERAEMLGASSKGTVASEEKPSSADLDSAHRSRRNGITYLRGGRRIEAVSELGMALEIYERLGQREWAADTCGELGTCLIEIQKFDEAELTFIKGLRYCEPSPEKSDQISRLRNNLGYLYQTMGQVEKACTEYELCLKACEATTGNPVAVLANVNIGELFLSIGDIDRAIPSFRAVILFTEEIPENDTAERMLLWSVSAHINLAAILESRDENVEALVLIRNGLHRVKRGNLGAKGLPVLGAARSLSIQLASKYTGLTGECLKASSIEGDASGAELMCGLLDCAYALVDGNEGAVLDAVHALKANGAAELAVQICESILLRKPDYRRAHLVRASCLSECGRVGEALLELEWCISADPNDPVPHNNKAHDLYKLARYTEAVTAADRAIQLFDGYASALEIKAYSLCHLGDTEGAKSSFLKIAELDPNSRRGIMARKMYEILLRIPREEFLATWRRGVGSRPDA